MKFFSALIINIMCSVLVFSGEYQAFINGQVLSMNDGNRIYEALLIKDEVVFSVGSTSEIKKLIKDLDESVELVDLQGKTLMPGIVDSHSHFPGSGLTEVTLNLNSPPLGSIQSIAAMGEMIKAASLKKDAGKLIIGFGYDDTLIEEKSHPTRVELDVFAPKHPVVLFHVSGHFVVANSLAMELMGYDRDSESPAGGIIHKDSEGNLLGLLEETAARPGQELLAKFSPTEQLSVLNKSVDDYLSTGVTTAQVGLANTPLLLSMVAASYTPLVPMRLVVLPDMTAFTKLVEGNNWMDWASNDYLSIPSVKIVADGSIQGFSGFLHDPYHTPYKGVENYRAYSTLSDSELTGVIARVYKQGMDVAIHGNGDASITQILNSLEQQSSNSADKRPVIIHAQMSTETQLDRMKELGVSPSFFTLHTYYWGDRHRDIFMGEARAKRISPARSALDRGLRFSIHTDSPVVPIDQFKLLWSAVNRKTASGKDLGLEQRITPMQALRALTIDAAWQYRLENKVGSLEKGKLADFIILSASPLENVESLDEINVLETYVGGEMVWAR